MNKKTILVFLLLLAGTVFADSCNRYATDANGHYYADSGGTTILCPVADLNSLQADKNQLLFDYNKYKTDTNFIVTDYNGMQTRLQLSIDKYNDCLTNYSTITTKIDATKDAISGQISDINSSLSSQVIEAKNSANQASTWTAGLVQAFSTKTAQDQNAQQVILSTISESNDNNFIVLLTIILLVVAGIGITVFAILRATGKKDSPKMSFEEKPKWAEDLAQIIKANKNGTDDEIIDRPTRKFVASKKQKYKPTPEDEIIEREHKETFHPKPKPRNKTIQKPVTTSALADKIIEREEQRGTQ